MMHMLETYLNGSVEIRKQINADLPAGYDYRCFEDFVLQRGHLLRSSALTEDEEAIVQEALVTAAQFSSDIHERKQCFANAQRLVLWSDTPELTYYEGFATSSLGFPFHHGWVVINGKVIDPTWRLEQPDTSRSLLPAHPVGEMPEPFMYWGFPCKSLDYLQFRITARGVIGSLLDDMEGSYPLLRGIDPNDEASWKTLVEEFEQAS